MASIRIATRSSALALWQAEYVAALLKQAEPGCEVELVHISTMGDQNQVNALATFGGERPKLIECPLVVVEAVKCHDDCMGCERRLPRTNRYNTSVPRWHGRAG